MERRVENVMPACFEEMIFNNAKVDDPTNYQ